MTPILKKKCVQSILQISNRILINIKTRKQWKIIGVRILKTEGIVINKKSKICLMVQTLKLAIIVVLAKSMNRKKLARIKKATKIRMPIIPQVYQIIVKTNQMLKLLLLDLKPMGTNGLHLIVIGRRLPIIKLMKRFNRISNNLFVSMMLKNRCSNLCLSSYH